MRRLLTGTVLLCFMAAPWAADPATAAGTYSQDAVKAAYLYRFTDYVGWPDAWEAGAPFDIAVFGAPGVARELRHLLASRTIKNQAARVREITNIQDVGSPRMLYVGGGHRDFLRRAIAANAGRSILWVTDEEGALESGSILNFLTVDHRVRFEVSLTAADRANLSISSELLSVAARVNGERQRVHAS